MITCLVLLCTCTLNAEIERRAAIDVGSGGTKLMIADVELETNQIEHVVLETVFPVAYQAALEKSADGTFDAEIQAEGLKAFQEIKHIVEQFEVQKVAAVATSAFRKANNACEFVANIARQFQIDIKIIPQREEGEIAFYSALATSGFDPQQLVVWDIGTGSLQITTLNPEGRVVVYMGEQMGSVAFKSYIIDVIQEKELAESHSPNPINEEELKMADSYARAFARKAFPLIKEKINGHPLPIIGIGRLFYHSIRPLASEGSVITRKRLRAFIESALNKTDAELNNPFAHVDVSNCILALAIMKALHIQAIYPIETTSTQGVLVQPSYWKK